VLPLWGFLQLVLGGTEYRYATLQSALQLAALSATAWTAYVSLPPSSSPKFLNAVAGFGFVVSIASVLAYYTSPHQVLWLVDVRYPDVWGPFLSRNNFAQFLEITLPVALWLALHRPSSLLYWAMAASMLAAGFASASRAGAILLCLETLAAFLLAPSRNLRRAAGFCTIVLLLATVADAQTLLRRFTLNPLDERAKIYQSSVAMIAARPWTGYGLGSFASVYPEFARFDSGYVIEHAHSDWLEWTTEGGLGFTATWAILFLPAARKVREHWWALGIPAVLLHALVDFPMARLGIAAWIFLLLGALESLPSPQPFRRIS
jgi:O-antigen polymerase